jgi:hypothetical protein
VVFYILGWVISAGWELTYATSTRWVMNEMCIR